MILLASARKNGNTSSLAKEYAQLTHSRMIDLNDYKINHFNYLQQKDDFNDLIKEIIKYETIVLASPVYWYSVSSLMKAFLDRLTELLIFDKELGRKLRGKQGALLATGASDRPESCFEQQIKLSFDYLDINYKGMLYCFCENNFKLLSHQKAIDDFIATNSHPSLL